MLYTFLWFPCTQSQFSHPVQSQQSDSPYGNLTPWVGIGPTTALQPQAMSAGVSQESTIRPADHSVHSIVLLPRLFLFVRPSDAHPGHRSATAVPAAVRLSLETHGYAGVVGDPALWGSGRAGLPADSASPWRLRHPQNFGRNARQSTVGRVWAHVDTAEAPPLNAARPRQILSSIRSAGTALGL